MHKIPDVHAMQPAREPRQPASKPCELHRQHAADDPRQNNASGPHQPAHMHDRTILHSDINCAYAQIECQADPSIRDQPVVVGGDVELRHGIVLAKNLIAKKFDIKTGEALWEARRKCPDLVVVQPNYALYKEVSRCVRKIYYDYTDKVEPFGLDECWLDVSGSLKYLGMNGLMIANEISERIKSEIGVTVSVGVSWNKIFAKFGSDYRKPDAITAITRDNYKHIVWNSKVRELLYVGRATERKLHSAAIFTIGELAHAEDIFLQRTFGKIGFILRDFARGEDTTEVMPLDPEVVDVHRERKSYGNGITFIRDITDDVTAHGVCWWLSEKVAECLRRDAACASTIEVGVRDGETLITHGMQTTVPVPTNVTHEIAETAWRLMRQIRVFSEEEPVRGLYVRASKLSSAEHQQSSLFDPEPKRPLMEKLDVTIDDLRRRFGRNCVIRGAQALVPEGWEIDTYRDHEVHPVGYFHR